MVIAAESRGLDEKGVPDENACKVTVLGGETLFFATGTVDISVHRGTAWDAHEVAQTVYKSAQKRDAEALSTAWGEMALQWFNGQAESDVKVVADPDGGLVTGGFISFGIRGTPDAYARAIHYSAAAHQFSNQPSSWSPGQVGIAGVGREQVSEFLANKTPRALKAHAVVEASITGVDPKRDSVLVRTAVQFVIDNVTGVDKTRVGGPIDVAIIRQSGGIEWVSRKKECYKMDNPPVCGR